MTGRPNPAADGSGPDLLIGGPSDAVATLALAHGAGAPMDSPFMTYFADGLARAGLRVVRFEFPYMAAQRTGAPKRPPDREAVLLDTWRHVIGKLGAPGLFIGGKSLGGRMASMVADEAGVAGCVCLGYPFHPPGRPERLRTPHLETLETPTLIIQGTADPFGSREEIGSLQLSKTIRFTWMADGDHNFRPPARSPATEEGNLRAALEAVCGFIDRTRIDTPTPGQLAQ